MASPREGGGLPAFIVIGTMKGGTSSLHHYFSRHPEICMSAAKEPNFFVEARNFGKGLGWYRSLFADQTKVCGEASPAYSKRHQHQGVPERLHDALPHVKLIYVLRDPIDRIVSHYLHNRIVGRETRSLAAAVAAKSYRNNYVRTSMYGFQLAAFLPYFPLERILIATSEALKAQRAETLKSMFRFIGVDPHYAAGEFDRLVNQTPLAEVSEPAALVREDRDRLAEHLAPDIEELRALTGQRFAHWSL
jgi:hypothetical protein